MKGAIFYYLRLLLTLAALGITLVMFLLMTFGWGESPAYSFPVRVLLAAVLFLAMVFWGLVLVRTMEGAHRG